MVQPLITTYAYYQVVYSVLSDTNNYDGRINLPMINNSIHLYRNSYQKILLEVRSLSRKLLTINDRDFYFNIINNVTGELEFRRVGAAFDNSPGRLAFEFQINDLDNVAPGEYNFSVSVIDSNNNETFLFLDQDRNATGSLSVIDKAMPPFIPSMTIADFIERVDNPPNYNPYYISAICPGNGQTKFIEGLHTASVYCTTFTGTFKVQGSLAEDPSDNDFFDIYTDQNTVNTYYTFTSYTGVLTFNFGGAYQWIRFWYEPDPMLNTGSITQVLFRGENNPRATDLTHPYDVAN